MISASKVDVFFGRKQILHKIDFEAAPRRFTAIVGPNGSGKSTFLKALAGEIAHHGEIFLNGQPLHALKPWQAASRRAVMAQQTTLSFPFTVREIVRLGLTSGFSGARPGEIEQLPERALEAVDLKDFSGRYYQELSGGEQQRAQLARVLCQIWSPVLHGEPRFLLLDEPVSSLDIKHQIAIMEIARDYAMRGGGVIAVLHDLNLMSMFADRVAVFHEGRVAAAGTPKDVLTDRLMEAVFGCRLRVGALPAPGTPFVLPHSAV